MMNETNTVRIATNTLGLADGTYAATWTGYELSFDDVRSLDRTVTTDVGCRGFEVQVTVRVIGADVFQVA